MRLRFRYAFHLAIYHLSGQATADEQEQARRAQEYAQEQELKRRKKEAQIELTRVLAAAWQEFLTANRAKFKQIALVKDSQEGDYSCLQIRKDKWDFVSPYKSDTEIKAAEQKAEVSTYQVRDSIADELVQWLNNSKSSDKTDWKYDDLQNMDVDLPFRFRLNRCWSPKEVWRANRYQKRIE